MGAWRQLAVSSEQGGRISEGVSRTLRLVNSLLDLGMERQLWRAALAALAEDSQHLVVHSYPRDPKPPSDLCGHRAPT